MKLGTQLLFFIIKEKIKEKRAWTQQEVLDVIDVVVDSRDKIKIRIER